MDPSRQQEPQDASTGPQSNDAGPSPTDTRPTTSVSDSLRGRAVQDTAQVFPESFQSTDTVRRRPEGGGYGKFNRQ